MREFNCRVYTIWLSDEMMKAIKHIAVQDSVSVASIIRDLLDDYINIRYADTV